MVRGLIALLLLGRAAQAGVPVVHDGGDGATVAAKVAERTGLPTDQLDPVPLEDLLRAPARAIGSASLRHCAGEPGRMTDIRAFQVRAEAAWREQDAAGAMDQLDLGMARLGCLEERVEAPVVARMFLLRGGLAARVGNPDLARAELRSALSLQPGLAWDPGFPAEGEPLLAEAAADTRRVRLEVVPPAGSAGPWIDGKALSTGETAIDLSPGLHLVQVPSTAGIRSAWLMVEGEATLVLPSSFRRPVLERLADPAGQQEVGRLLQAALPSFELAYVQGGGGLYLLALEEGALRMTTLVEPAPAPPPEEEGRKKKKR